MSRRSWGSRRALPLCGCGDRWIASPIQLCAAGIAIPSPLRRPRPESHASWAPRSSVVFNIVGEMRIFLHEHDSWKSNAQERTPLQASAAILLGLRCSTPLVRWRRRFYCGTPPCGGGLGFDSMATSKGGRGGITRLAQSTLGPRAFPKTTAILGTCARARSPQSQQLDLTAD